MNGRTGGGERTYPSIFRICWLTTAGPIPLTGSAHGAHGVAWTSLYHSKPLIHNVHTKYMIIQLGDHGPKTQ